MTTNRAFTLIELLVVIAIIGILSSVVMASLNSARQKADIARAQLEVRQIANAINQLYNDTGEYPGHQNVLPCIQNQEFYLDAPEAGIVASDGSFPNWRGPYMKSPLLDPWGTTYFYDPDYICGTLETSGCGRILNGNIRAVVSFGPDKAESYYGTDDIVIPLCRYN